MKLSRNQAMRLFMANWTARGRKPEELREEFKMFEKYGFETLLPNCKIKRKGNYLSSLGIRQGVMTWTPVWYQEGFGLPYALRL